MSSVQVDSNVLLPFITPYRVTRVESTLSWCKRYFEYAAASLWIAKKSFVEEI